MINKALVHFDLDSEGKADPEIAGAAVLLVALVCYPGSRVTDIQIGNHVFQVPNASLAQAAQEADDVMSQW